MDSNKELDLLQDYMKYLIDCKIRNIKNKWFYLYYVKMGIYFIGIEDIPICSFNEYKFFKKSL